jgi:hypothetical protein
VGSRRIAIAAAVLVLVLCGAMTGLTYAVVALSKDSSVGDTGVMVVKGSDVPVSTGGGQRRVLGLLRHHLDLASQPGAVLQDPARHRRNQVLQQAATLESMYLSNPQAR